MEDLSFRIEAVKEKVNLSDISGEFIKGHGSCTCPFCGHRNKGYIYNNQYFKCYRSKCGVRGDVIKIHQLLSNFENYMMSLRDLEFKYGLSYTQKVQHYIDRNDLLVEVMDVYVHELHNHPEVREYLISRGFSEQTIDLTPIGYAPPETHTLSKYDIDLKLLQEHGLINTEYKDFFRNRIIFPIRNHLGNLIHLSGRWFGDIPYEDCPKYKDTKPVSLIPTSKSFLLFEEELQSYAARSKTIIISEGIPDTLILKQLGLPVVGLLGLEGLNKHYYKLQDFKTIIAIFDTDRFEADHPIYPNQQKSWIRVLPQLVELQCMLPTSMFYTYTVEEGKDINDYYLLVKDKLPTYINNNRVELFKYLVDLWGTDLSKHIELLKLVSSTGRGASLLQDCIPSDLTPVEYALKVFNE